MAFERFKPEVRRAQRKVAEQDYIDAQSTIDTDRPVDKLRTDITEILGERTGVLEGHYRRKADSLVKKAEFAEAHKDKMGMRESYIRHGKNKAELKIQRVQAKIDAAPNAHGLLARQRAATLEHLEYRQKVRTNSIKKLEGHRLEKPEHSQKKIDALVQKKIRSMMRKAERKVLREQYGIGSHDRRKRIDALVKLTPEQKRRIVREAILLVRKQNIERGTLDDSYTVDDMATTRAIGKDYARVIE